MWPFKKKTKVGSAAPQAIMFSQVDSTETFGDNLRLGPEDWIETTPISVLGPGLSSEGLPAPGASADEIYRVADRLSLLRESIPIANDGVYCPVCHRANISLSRLRTPCPTCGRPLLKFGWD
jgi:hypothetical protein